LWVIPGHARVNQLFLEMAVVLLKHPIMHRVMVVDDEEGVRQLLSRWLSAWGYDTRVAISANDALEQMSAAPASIVLCDVVMPVRDGIWLAEQIARQWPETAVIMASGAQDMDTVTRSRQHGAVDFVSKPFGREMLLQALRRASEHHALHQCVAV
jgi:DNA-binding NtrC family response regulator